MSTAEVIAFVESGKFDVDDKKSMNSAYYCIVFMNIIHSTSQCTQLKDLKETICARNKYYKRGHT